MYCHLSIIAYSPVPNCRGGAIKWGGRQKVGTQKNYFQNQDKGGGKMCLKTFVMIRCKTK